jgi:LPS export ABC transporter permease LptF
MIIFRAVFGELLSPFAMSAFVMSALLLLEKIYRLVTLVVENRLRATELGLMLIYLLPQIFSITLPLAVVAAVSMTVIRQSLDSELICLRASGRSLWNYALPYFAFGVFAMAMTAAITLWIQPIAYSKFTDLQLDMIRYRAETKIIPGEFNYDFGDKVIHVGGRVSSRELTDIFIADRALPPGSPVITAQTGIIDVDDAARRVFFRLRDGQMVILERDDTALRTVDFSQMNYVLDFKPTTNAEINVIWGMSNAQLLQEWREPGPDPVRRLRRFLELYYRITTPVACLAFAIAALPMGIVDPRSGRAGSLLRSVFLVVAYYLVWVGFKDLAYTQNATPHVLWIPPLLIASYGLVRLWLINADVASLWQLLRRA